MMRGSKALILAGVALAMSLVLSPSALNAQAAGKGSLIGYVFEQNGSTPVRGAVVLVKNLTTGTVLEAPPSDDLGMFKVLGLDPGLYALGVTSAKGSFNSQDFFGVTAQQTAKISIALDPYDAMAASGAAAVIKEQRQKGESFIGKIVKCDPAAKEAEVFVEIGLLQAEDRIHVKGQSTDFYLDVRGLETMGTRTKRVTSGSSGVFKSAKPCQAGDFVYIVCKRGVPPFFLAPLGIAAIVAGAVPLAATFDEEQASPYKIR
jgi:hypothetical protein